MIDLTEDSVRFYLKSQEEIQEPLELIVFAESKGEEARRLRVQCGREPYSLFKFMVERVLGQPIGGIGGAVRFHDDIMQQVSGARATCTSTGDSAQDHVSRFLTQKASKRRKNCGERSRFKGCEFCASGLKGVVGANAAAFLILDSASATRVLAGGANLHQHEGA